MHAVQARALDLLKPLKDAWHILAKTDKNCEVTDMDLVQNGACGLSSQVALVSDGGSSSHV